MPTAIPGEMKPDLGSPVTSIETPAVLVDMDVMEPANQRPNDRAR